jgi:hypothetical protein
VNKHGHVRTWISDEDHEIAKIDAEASHSPNSAQSVRAAKA